VSKQQPHLDKDVIACYEALAAGEDLLWSLVASVSPDRRWRRRSSCRRRKSALGLDRFAEVALVVPSDVGATGIAEIEERLRVGYASVFAEIARDEPAYVFGEGDPEFRGACSRASMIFWWEGNLQTCHQNGNVITHRACRFESG